MRLDKLCKVEHGLTLLASAGWVVLWAWLNLQLLHSLSWF
jgi:hypothetical protein